MKRRTTLPLFGYLILSATYGASSNFPVEEKAYDEVVSLIEWPTNPIGGSTQNISASIAHFQNTATCPTEDSYSTVTKVAGIPVVSNCENSYGNETILGRTLIGGENLSQLNQTNRALKDIERQLREIQVCHLVEIQRQINILQTQDKKELQKQQENSNSVITKLVQELAELKINNAAEIRKQWENAISLVEKQNQQIKDLGAKCAALQEQIREFNQRPAVTENEFNKLQQRVSNIEEKNFGLHQVLTGNFTEARQVLDFIWEVIHDAKIVAKPMHLTSPDPRRAYVWKSKLQ